MKNNKVSEVKLTYKSKVKAVDRPKITQSKDIYNLVINDWDDIELCESFYILCLDRGNKVKSRIRISKGGTAGTVVDAKLVFVAALKCIAPAIILVHNHPSGNLRPSQADIDVTRRIKRGGELLDIVVLDHLIITPDNGYYSFADEGMI